MMRRPGAEVCAVLVRTAVLMSNTVQQLAREAFRADFHRK
jgi:hypothetical protein